MDKKTRCGWVPDNELYRQYHDLEWGVPLHDDQSLFEAIVLDGAQAGLSWFTILKRRENYRQAYENFEVAKVAAFNDKKFLELLYNEGIIRNRLKINSSINNARRVLEVQQEFGSLAHYLWQFVGGKPKVNHWKNVNEIPAISAESETMSRDMKKRGFTFVGPTICYAFMQAAGMVNDHTIDCFRYRELL